MQDVLRHECTWNESTGTSETKVDGSGLPGTTYVVDGSEYLVGADGTVEAPFGPGVHTWTAWYAGEQVGSGSFETFDCEPVQPETPVDPETPVQPETPVDGTDEEDDATEVLGNVIEDDDDPEPKAQETLPVTGSDTGRLALLGALTLGLGGTLVAATRKEEGQA